MTDNLAFFFDFNKLKQTILERYDYFESKRNEEKRKLADEIDTFTFKIIYKRPITGETTNSFDVVYKTYTDNKMRQADMLYEFYIGKSMNYIKQYLPNFIYTFGFNYRGKTYSKDDGFRFEIDNIFRSDQFTLDEQRITHHCQTITNKTSGLFLEYVPKSRTLEKILGKILGKKEAGEEAQGAAGASAEEGTGEDEDPEFKSNFDYNLFAILFQIYAALFALEGVYTHQDLHSKNIMIITLDYEISIIYNIRDVEYIITTKYIPVIIDYATSHLSHDPENDSMKFINLACNTTCNLRYGSRECYLNQILYSNVSINPHIDMIIKAKSFGKANKSIDLLLINKLMFEDPNIPEGLPLKAHYKSIFKLLQRTEKIDWGWKRKDEGRIISSAVAEHPSYFPRKKDDKIRYTSDMITEFLIPHYNEHYRASISIKSTQIKIDCDFSKRQKWTYTEPTHPVPVAPTTVSGKEKKFDVIAFLKQKGMEAKERKGKEAKGMEGKGGYYDKYMKYKAKYLALKYSSAEL